MKLGPRPGTLVPGDGGAGVPRWGYEAARCTHARDGARLSARGRGRRAVARGYAGALDAQHPAVAVQRPAGQPGDRAVRRPGPDARVQRSTRPRGAPRVRRRADEPAPRRHDGLAGAAGHVAPRSWTPPASPTPYIARDAPA